MARDEKEQRWTLGANHAFSDEWLSGWTLGATITGTRSRSNVAIYTYDRMQTGMSLGRRF